MVLINQKPGCWNTPLIGLNDPAVRMKAIHTSKNGNAAVVKRIETFFIFLGFGS
jgi:hypothetical protein